MGDGKWCVGYERRKKVGIVGMGRKCVRYGGGRRTVGMGVELSGEVCVSVCKCV